jgi:hypothetical protein
VPDHEDIVGNETANQLAKLDSECPFIGPEPACGISVAAAKRNVRDWTETIKSIGNPYKDSNRQRDSHKDPQPEELRDC